MLLYFLLLLIMSWNVELALVNVSSFEGEFIYWVSCCKEQRSSIILYHKLYQNLIRGTGIVYYICFYLFHLCVLARHPVQKCCLSQQHHQMVPLKILHQEQLDTVKCMSFIRINLCYYMQCIYRLKGLYHRLYQNLIRGTGIVYCICFYLFHLCVLARHPSIVC